MEHMKTQNLAGRFDVHEHSSANLPIKINVLW